MTIPVTSSRVNIAELHPTMRYRVELMMTDPRMAGYKVVSGVRTYEQQKSLYSGWRKRLAGVPGYKHYNLAANPDKLLGVAFDGLVVKGSWHMIQSDGWGHAVDFRKPVFHTKKRADLNVARAGGAVGVHQTVLSEWWHCQWRSFSQIFPGPVLAYDEEEDDMIVLKDTSTNEHWLAASGKARVLSDPAKWMSGWSGPVRTSPTMTHVIEDLYEVV